MTEFGRIIKKIYDREYETTTDLLEAAHEVLRAAELIETRPNHAMLWDAKVHVLRLVNAAFETGYYTGDAYEELRKAAWLLNESEIKAGKQAMQTYARNL